MWREECRPSWASCIAPAKAAAWREATYYTQAASTGMRGMKTAEGYGQQGLMQRLILKYKRHRIPNARRSSTTSTMTTLLQRFITVQNWGTVADGTPIRDFLPTRDCSSKEGWQATFIEAPTGEQENGKLVVRLTCPGSVRETGVPAYRRQLRALEKIIEVEEDEQSGGTHSWFGSTSFDADGVFTVHLSEQMDKLHGWEIDVGVVLAIWVHISRIDKREGSSVHRVSPFIGVQTATNRPETR
ncbi:hypothetical protein C8R47DRAFT_1267704 [Mycena vitilis]|nr:hypothetical protein C8R47DRAFT_1267704 [Mycena vitilis]